MPQQMESMIIPPRLPLVVYTKSRPNTFTRDSRLINCYIETDEAQELNIVKRPGFVENATYSESASTARGMFHWDGAVYTIFGSTLYRDGTSVGTGLNTSGGQYWFSSILGAVPKLVLGNGAKTYAYSVAGGLTADLHTIDVDFPATTVKGIVYLNGATYVAQSTSQIWGSAINSVSVAGDWTALNFLSAQIEPDNLVALSKQLVYVIAIGEWSLEVFFDAGNPQGSPLGAVQGSKSAFGCENADSLQRIDDKLFWLSTSQTAALQISMLEQLNHQIISTKDIDRILQNADTSTVYSWQLKLDGHTFYVITLKVANITLAYDIEENLWYHWTDSNGNYLPFVASTYTVGNLNLVQHETNGKVYTIGSTYVSDDGVLFNVDIYTPTFDANNRRRKQLGKITFIGDQVTGSVLQVRFSEDDMQTWTNFQSVDLGQVDPSLIRCGSFRKRAYHLRHKCNTKFRIQAVDVQYDLGLL